ncbi:FUSC family protein [Phaeacidiphilus oryzae]|uniref:FUSC family protein n=1 Tax=Phaeacidiphilus oryzae TaxID=348818 RepID=UPI00068FC898|nr:FUSC family protein [Phaeacidiphilus oryzae]
MSTTAAQLPRPRRTRIRPLPLRGLFRLRPTSDTWYKQGLSAALTLAMITVPLLALDRLNLAVYATAGGLAAMYGHGLPYPARARSVLGVGLGMFLAAAAATTTAALTGNGWIRVAVVAVIAACQKAGCDASRIGPPGPVVMTFLSCGLAFLPGRLSDLPQHLALTAMGAALAWLVCMAPALVRPHGPERIAVARALEAAAPLASEAPSTAQRHAAGGLLLAAWQTLGRMSARGPRPAALRHSLEQLLLRAETVLAAADAPDGPAPAATAEQLRRWAADLRSDRPLPRWAAAGELPPHPVPAPPSVRAKLRSLAPGSPLLPVVARVAVGSAAGGWISLALGVGHPYWGVITAAAVFTGNAVQGWTRAVNRVAGSLAGLLIFTALQPVLHLGGAVLVAVALVCMLCAELAMPKGYWLGVTFVTPLALVMNEFGGPLPTGQLVSQRWIDTCVGAAVGLLGCLLVPNRRATRRVHRALGALSAADRAARRRLAELPAPGGLSVERRLRAQHALGDARHTVSAALVELRAALEAAAGEWWQPAGPAEDPGDAQDRARLLLAELTRRRAALAFERPVASAVRVRIPEPSEGPVAIELPLTVPAEADA